MAEPVLFLTDRDRDNLLVTQQVERTLRVYLDTVRDRVPEGAPQENVDEARVLFDKAFGLIVNAIARPINLEGLN